MTRRRSAGRRSVDDRRRRLRQPRARVVHRSRPPAHGRGARGAPSRDSWPRSPPTPASGCSWSARRRTERSSSVPNGTRFLDQDRVEGEDPTDAVRPAHDHEPQARGRDDPRAGPAAAQPVQPGPRRGRRVRGADRLARRPRRPADRAVHPPPGRVGARRGGPARGAGHLPQPAALAQLDRHRAREAEGGTRGRPATGGAGTGRAGRPSARVVAKVHYEADGPSRPIGSSPR